MGRPRIFRTDEERRRLAREKAKRWSDAHPERVKAIAAQSRARHRDKILAYSHRPEVRERQRTLATIRNKRPDVRERLRASWRAYENRNKATRLARYRTPEGRAKQHAWRDNEARREYARRYYHKHKAVIRARQSSPEARAKRRVWAREYARTRYRQNPVIRAKMQVASASWKLSASGQAALAAYRQRPDVKERMRLNNARYRVLRPDLTRAKQARHRATARYKQHVKEYQLSPIGKATRARSNHNRRSKERAITSIADLTAAQWEVIKAAYAYRCAYCGRKPKRLEKDHIKPIALGGDLTATNIVPACIRCNRQKAAKLVPVQPVLLTD